jgi:hypothetical protein
MSAWRLALRIAIPAVAYVLAATLTVVVFIWSGVELWVALLVAFAGLLVFAWYVDRKNKGRKA